MENDENTSKTDGERKSVDKKLLEGSKSQKSKLSLTNKSEGEVVLNTINADSGISGGYPKQESDTLNPSKGDQGEQLEKAKPESLEKPTAEVERTPSEKAVALGNKSEKSAEKVLPPENLVNTGKNPSNKSLDRLGKANSKSFEGRRSQLSLKSGQKKEEEATVKESKAIMNDEPQGVSEPTDNADEPPSGRADFLRSVLRPARRQQERRPNIDNRTVEVLESLKDQVVMFQERRGVPRDNYTFSTVISAILTLAVQAIYAVFGLMLALAPVTEIAIHVARFTLERLCEIAYIRSRQDIAIKMVLFTLQLLTILFLATFIFGTILLPVYMMGIIIVSKIASVIPGS